MKTLIMFLLCCSIIACDRAEPEYPFIGKWAGLSSDEYIEAHITADSLYTYEHTMGYTNPIHFTVKEDSLYYTTYDMVVGYQVIDDSILILSNSDFSDTIYKLDQSLIMIDEADLKGETAFREYESAFYNRAIAYYRSLGFEDYWDYTAEPTDTVIHLPPDHLKEFE